MNLTMVNTLDWPKEKIVGILASGEEPVSMDRLPNVSKYKIHEFRRREDRFFKKIEWNVDWEIPFWIQKIIGSNRLQFMEETVWDNNRSSFTTKIIPFTFQDKIKCKIVVAWDTYGKKRTRRKVELKVKVGLPVIGRKIEETIAGFFKENNEKYTELLTQSLAERLGAAE